MNSDVRSGALAPNGVQSSAEEAKGRVVTVKRVIPSAVAWSLAGTALFFGLYALFSAGRSPVGTFGASFFSGGVGALVSTLWLRRSERYAPFLFCILVAYALRVLVGVVIYWGADDPHYFQGDGEYVHEHRELVWTWDNTVTAADSIQNDGEWRPRHIFPTGEDKNAHIHTWMGLFLASGGSRHALDLTPFNAFHHIVAGALIVALALACRYSLRVSLLSGALTAWIPWGFPASFMWRDSVGLSWVVLSILLLRLGTEWGFWGSVLFAIPAAFLAWADRSVYLVVVGVVTALSVLHQQRSTFTSVPLKALRLILVLGILGLGAYVLSRDVASLAFDRYGEGASGSQMLSRLLMAPLLVLRALAGPFPWFVGSGFTYTVLFDYAYHVVQLGVFFVCVRKFRGVFSNASLLLYATAVYWFVGIIAVGVHTGYLAVAFPFVLPLVLNAEPRLERYVIVSFVCFVLANGLYIALGLTGSGLVQGITGY